MPENTLTENTPQNNTIVVMTEEDDRVAQAPVTPVMPDEHGVVTVTEVDADEADALPRHAVRNADGTVTLPLKYPRTLRFRNPNTGTVREKQYDALTFHRLTGADMRAITAVAKDAMIVVALAKSTHERQGDMNALFDVMDGVDAGAASDVVSTFLGSGPRTGR